MNSSINGTAGKKRWKANRSRPRPATWPAAADDFARRVVWAGESVDLVRDIPSAREVIERIVDQAASVLQGGAALVRD